MDSCAIIAAHRIHQFKRLAGQLSLHTTRECRDELIRGDKEKPDYVHVDPAIFDRDIHIHEVSQLQLATAQLEAPRVADIDPGEKELLAYCAAQDQTALLLTTGDKAAILAACQLGLQDRLVSLEELLKRTGYAESLPTQFTRKWLVGVKTEYQLDTMPPSSGTA